METLELEKPVESEDETGGEEKEVTGIRAQVGDNGSLEFVKEFSNGSEESFTDPEVNDAGDREAMLRRLRELRLENGLDAD